MKWHVLFDVCIQVLNSPTNIPTSTMSALKVVDNMTGQETALLNIILSCCHMLHVDTISVL